MSDRLPISGVLQRGIALPPAYCSADDPSVESIQCEQCGSRNSSAANVMSGLALPHLAHIEPSQRDETFPPIGKLTSRDDDSNLCEIGGSVRESFRRQAKRNMRGSTDMKAGRIRP